MYRPYRSLSLLTLCCLLIGTFGCEQFRRQPKHELIAPFTSDAIRRKKRSPGTDILDKNQSRGLELRTPVPPPPIATTDDIELVWKADHDGSDAYRIRYGYTESDLRYDLKVLRADLSEHEDPQHGTVFRFTLEKIPANRPLYFTVAACRGTQESPPSPVFEVKVKRELP